MVIVAESAADELAVRGDGGGDSVVAGFSGVSGAGQSNIFSLAE